MDDLMQIAIEAGIIVKEPNGFDRVTLTKAEVLFAWLVAKKAVEADRALFQQEPVAKPYAYEYGRGNGDGTYSVVIEKGDLVQTAPAVYSYVRPRNAHKDWPIKELFDHPPAQRTWVGLTYEEAKEIYTRIHGYDSSKRIAEAIEAKLKEKNT